jgi:hypothetical protein
MKTKTQCSAWFRMERAMRQVKSQNARALDMRDIRNCRCGAKPGHLHNQGCGVEPCQRCGRQAISCDCIYVVCGMDPRTLEEDHPEIYSNGPTDEMYARWDREWPRRVPWSGEYPGAAECRLYGFWCVGPPWKSVPEGTPDATEDLNRLLMTCRWDQQEQKYKLPA